MSKRGCADIGLSGGGVRGPAYSEFYGLTIPEPKSQLASATAEVIVGPICGVDRTTQ